MRIGLIFLFWICFRISPAQGTQDATNFLKAYREAVDPKHALDTVKSITLKLRWIIRSISPPLNRDEYRIQHLSSDPIEDFDLVLKPEGWKKKNNWVLDLKPNISGIQRIREYFLRLDTTASEKLKVVNDSITVFEMDEGADFARELTFDTKTKLPVRLDGYSRKNPTVKSSMHVKYGDYKWFSGVRMYTKMEMDFDHNDTHIVQTLVSIHFNLTPEQVMALKD